jgi:hypothetical protein
MQKVGDFYDKCHEINIHGRKPDIEVLLVPEKQNLHPIYELASNGITQVLDTYCIYSWFT